MITQSCSATRLQEDGLECYRCSAVSMYVCVPADLHVHFGAMDSGERLFIFLCLAPSVSV